MPAEHINTTMTLDRLLEGILREEIAGLSDIPVADITSDSRRVVLGGVFFACSGATHHGLEFRRQAVEAGVCAIVYDSDPGFPVPRDIGVPLIPVAGLRATLGKIANRFFEYPSRDVNVIGVTGTNGKTTVAWLIAQCFAALGHACAYAGTIGYGVNKLVSGDGMTSPDVIEMHRRLALFRNAGATHAAVEVSSHALDQGRVNDLTFGSTLFTNLSREHLDYHGDMRAYGEAKARLFTQHDAGHRIINLDSDFGAELASKCSDDVVVVSIDPDRSNVDRPFVFVRSIDAHGDGSDIRVQSSWGEAELKLPIAGEFNVANAIIVLALLLSEGVELKTACESFRDVEAPPGRMQRVPSTQGPAVYVDYAHSPAALDVSLRALRAHCLGKLWCVFGCGGDRDAGKRPLMGRIAVEQADQVVITNDNPRSEPPAEIIAQIQAGLKQNGDAIVIEDRATAIGWAVTNANVDDIILIAGKGHENYQIIGSERVDFSDFGVVAATLAATEEGA